jgi:hypothetical protein
MDKLITKLNYKGDKRILILEGESKFVKSLSGKINGTRIDSETDPKFLYNFIIIFAETSEDVDRTFLDAVQNLYEDGIIWFVYPKSPDSKDNIRLTRKKGWNSCKDAGFEAVRHISIDDSLNATRFRNKKFIKRRNKD